MMLIFTFSYSVFCFIPTGASFSVVILAILSLLVYFPAKPLGKGDSQIRGRLGYRNPRRPERLDLFRRGPFPAGDDGTRVPHPLPLGCRLARHESDAGLGHLRLHEGP